MSPNQIVVPWHRRWWFDAASVHGKQGAPSAERPHRQTHATPLLSSLRRCPLEAANSTGHLHEPLPKGTAAGLSGSVHRRRLLLFLQLEWILDTAGVWPGVRAAGPNSLTRFCECQIASHLQRFLFIFFIFFAECYIRDTQQRLLFFYFHCRVPAQGHSAKFLFFCLQTFSYSHYYIVF